METFNRFYKWYEYLEDLPIRISLARFQDYDGKLYYRAYEGDDNVVGQYNFSNNDGWVQL